MSKHTVNTVFKNVIEQNNNNKLLSKHHTLTNEQKQTLLKALHNNLLPYNTINYIENEIPNNKVQIQLFTTDKQGQIINISHILYMLCKAKLPYIKLNRTYNYVIGNLTTAQMLFTFTGNYVMAYHKTIQYNLTDNIRIHEITAY